MTGSKTTSKGPVTVNPTSMTVHLCVPEDQIRFLPKRRRAPEMHPRDVPLPRQGDVVYLSRTSAWHVLMVIFDWLAVDTVRVEVWLEHVSPPRHRAPVAVFSLTQ